MPSQGRIFEDLARVVSGAAGALSGVRGEVEGILKQKIERFLTEADMVPRDEFNAIKDVAVAAREAQETLEIRVAALEEEVKLIKKRVPNRAVKKPSKK